MIKKTFINHFDLKFLLALAVTFINVCTFSQSNFKMTGTLTDVVKDSVVVEYVERNPDKKIVNFTVPVENGKFQFELNLDKAYSGTLKLKSNLQKIIYFFFVPNEEVNVKGTFESKYTLNFSGTDFYSRQYPKVIDQCRPFNRQFESAKQKYEQGVASGGDENKLKDEQKVTNREINKNFYKSNYDYVCKHVDEDATATIILDVGVDSVITAIDKLSPKVKEGRFQGYLSFWKKAFERIAMYKKASANRTDTVEIGKTAPNFTLNDLQNKPFTLSSIQGKYVVLDFWGSWCVWCIKGFPKMKEFYSKYKDKLEIVGIDCNDKMDAWKAAVEKHQLPWKQVKSEDAKTEVAYAVKGYPYKIVIAPDGKVLRIFIGESENFYQYMDEIMTKQ